MESEAEAQRFADRRKVQTRKSAELSGDTLIDLAIDDHQIGLGGRHLFTFVKRNRTLNLPWNRLRTGAPVILSSLDNGLTISGVVSARNVRSIQVAVDGWIEDELYDLGLAADEVTRNRERSALQAVRMASGRMGVLRQILLGQSSPADNRPRMARFGKLPVLAFGRHSSHELNLLQRQAIAFALSAEDFAIIHGPPGTGKTTSVVEFIRQAILRGEKVLACAPSNTAVDNMLERLIALNLCPVRLGHPARVKSELRSHTLDALVEQHDNARWVKQLRREAEMLYRKADRFTRARPTRGAKQDMRREAKHLKAEARRLEKDTIQQVLAAADVICATTTIDNSILGDRQFDWVVIDEACQSTESGCWAPILRGTKVLFAGDHCQLPPTVLSSEAAAEGYQRSMMQRLVETHGDTVTRQLQVQYRMHEQIMRFSSLQFYGDSLTADPSVIAHRLTDLPEIENSPFCDMPLLFIDTAGADYHEELEPEGSSKRNPQEGRLALSQVKLLLDAGLPASQIGVIAPYAAQVRWLREQAKHRDMEIDTVDGFQGREKEAMVISLVRSNREGEIGFLADTRRMNVALTRARRKLIVIGDSALLGAHPFYLALIDYFTAQGAYRSVWEMMSTQE
ncbi:MAG: AAA domain-containing protein [Pirellulales bacterium]